MTPVWGGVGVDQARDQVEEHRDVQTHRFEISSNASLSPRLALAFFSGIACASFVIAGGFALLGYWPILPFAGAELVVLGFALGVSLRRNSYRERVVITEERVLIERGTGAQRERTELARFWSSAELLPARWRNHPSRLVIRAHGHYHPLGDCLTEDARRVLWQRLRAKIGKISEAPRLADGD